MLRRHLRVSFALAESKPYAIDLIFDLSASPTLPPLPDEHFLTLLPLIPVNIERIVFIVHDSPMQQILETIRHDYVMAGFTSVICHNLAESIALLAELRHQQFDDRWH